MANYKKLQGGDLADIETLTEQDKLTAIVNAFIEAVSPSERLTLYEWADKYRVLPSTTSSEPGPWRTSRFPFLKRIMWCMSPQSIARVVVVVKGAQLGLTEILINGIFYNAHHYPGPAAYIQKTLDAAKEFATQKLNPSIEACPAVAKTLGSEKSPIYSDTVLNRGFPGGFTALGGANSTPFLRSKSLRDAYVDEEDSYKESIGEEGSPIALIRKRQANFPMSKLVRTSTPTITETSTIEPAYYAGSQEQCYLPCPHCNPDADYTKTYFVIEWKNIKWSKEINKQTHLPEDVWLECPMCNQKIYEHKKTWMLDNHRWLAKNETTGMLYEVGDVENPSFKISSLYSPLGFFSWRDAVQEFFEYKATNDIALLQVFENQTLANSFSMAGQDVSSTWLMSRKEDYIDPSSGEVLDVPEGPLVLTVGADVQKDRIEAEVVGWGLNHQSWSIDYKVFLGNTDFLGDRRGLDPNTGQPTVWTEFDRFLHQKFRGYNGELHPIECTLIDANYRSEQVNAFCYARESRRIYPCIGKPGFGHTGYIQRPKKRSERFQTWKYILWVDEIKDRVYQNFIMEEIGPGYCHFPTKDVYTSKHFQGLTCENKKVKIVGGQKKLYWETPEGARNEPLDCRVYAFGALTVYAPNLEYRAQIRQSPHKTHVGRKPKKRSRARVLHKGL